MRRTAVVAGMLGTLLLGVSAPAFAGDVTWLNAARPWGLQSGGLIDRGATNSLYTGSGAVEPCNTYVTTCTGVDSAHWQDTQNSDKSWTEVSLYDQWTLGVDGCLDSNAQWTSYGSAYTHTCNGGRYQNWYELDTTTGWALEDEQTGLFLDGGNGPNGNGQFSSVNVYTNSNYGNSDAYQRWH